MNATTGFGGISRGQAMLLSFVVTAFLCLLWQSSQAQPADAQTQAEPTPWYGRAEVAYDRSYRSTWGGTLVTETVRLDVLTPQQGLSTGSYSTRKEYDTPPEGGGCGENATHTGSFSGTIPNPSGFTYGNGLLPMGIAEDDGFSSGWLDAKGGPYTIGFPEFPSYENRVTVNYYGGSDCPPDRTYTYRNYVPTGCYSALGNAAVGAKVLEGTRSLPLPRRADHNLYSEYDQCTEHGRYISFTGTFSWHLTRNGGGGQGDRDGDGVADAADNCPSVPNSGQDPAACAPDAEFSTDWQEGDGNEVFFSASDDPDVPIASYKWDFGDGTTGTGRYARHTYAKPGRYYASLMVTSEDGTYDTEYKTVVANPVDTFAPAVHIYPGERYRPGSADTFLENSQLRWDKPNERYASCKDQVLADSGGFPSPSVPLIDHSKLTGSGATAYSRKASVYKASQKRCLDTTSLVRSNAPPEVAAKKENRQDGYVLNLAGSDPDITKNFLYAGEQNPAVDAPVYTEYEPGRYIIYWFFYPFNGWESRSIKEFHEGDWEHITVRLDADNDATEVAYYQHYCHAKKYDWSSPTVGKVDGTHPIVYSALGGHASFPSVEDGTPVGCEDWTSIFTGAGQWSEWDWASAEGDRWNTWNNTVNARTKSWYGYGGAWGDRSVLSSNLVTGALDNYGPPGPGPIRSKASDVVPTGW